MESKSGHADDTDGDDMATMSPVGLSHGKTAPATANTLLKQEGIQLAEVSFRDLSELAFTKMNHLLVPWVPLTSGHTQARQKMTKNHLEGRPHDDITHGPGEYELQKMYSGDVSD